MRVLFGVMGLFIVPTMGILIGTTMATTRWIILYQNTGTTGVLDVTGRLLACIIPIATIGAWLGWFLPPILMVIPIIVAEHPHGIRRAITRAHGLTLGYRRKILQATGPVLLLSLLLAITLSATISRSMEATARLLAHRRHVYLRTDDEEWVLVLLTATCALLFGPALIIVPLMSM